ncbi:phosphatase PAP2 family protein [Erythrobacter litoralis]|uniref:phosphatase PAP2 family protein n=1 Tax=Erythrobacter litoralis TaxID=39960 RepID=UPI00243562CA|nr:phosphatase PAP2 family protein [Erythrobacter litoralis]MDG6080173.1 phosphatase PAP2 family protein [Erythrobacter litoralis]
MMDRTHPNSKNSDASDDARVDSKVDRDGPEPVKAIEQADIAVADTMVSYRETKVVKALGTASEVADQPPLLSLCLGTFALGAILRNPRMMRAGGRMIASHLVATGIKAVIKKSVDRTRPSLLHDEQRYELDEGKRDEGDYNSFPSGHTAGAVAVAMALGREYPRLAWPARAPAAAIALIQIPRCAHYPSDITVGAGLGLLAEASVHGAVRLAEPD